MAEREGRLAELVILLGADDGYATGERSFPRAVSRGQGADIADALHDEMELATTARSHYARSQGWHIACERGCNVCCNEVVLVFDAEAVAVARWLVMPEQDAIRAAFWVAYERWSEGVADVPQRLAVLWRDKRTADYRALHVEQFKRTTMCAFNHDGACSIYPVRPLVCRAGHAVETAEHCDPNDDSGVPVQRLEFGPLDAFVQRAQRLLRATHHATGGERRTPKALCHQVAQLLRDHPDGDGPLAP